MTDPTVTSPTGPRRADAPARDGLGVRDAVVRYPAARRGRAGTTAVDGVSLDVARGEVLALLGPSGCGKSSLLRAVAGLEPLAAGDVTWAGEPVTDVPVHRRDFGLMFQDGQLFGHRDVAGNIAYGLAGRPRAAVAQRVTHLLELVGLPGAGPRAVATLSGGERQRVALARALAPGPRLLLLDEPLSALDRSLRERLALDLRAALLATGTTALFVTHDQDEAFTVADRVAVMAAGRLLQVDAPGALWRAPADEQVARFLGYEAFVAVRDAPAPLRDAAGPAAGGAQLALAPGALVVTADDERGLVGTVLAVHTRRGRPTLSVVVPGLGEVTASASGVVGAVLPAPGAAVTLGVTPDAVVVLPGE
ncbi:ABC transporter ATP-binding protein [Cellulomonas sp.]|uniref:ABC transporter ATP-binding protein n=1 Tax=Cellulomonas sp. TaxID=40001 RepID=UPI00258C9ADD|nr:ABC transporter ATP-binding protein [Cellulomonas sp.]MCR6688721.1 ABC transporter ATP-binding protein [Cellulomonas sp.]